MNTQFKSKLNPSHFHTFIKTTPTHTFKIKKYSTPTINQVFSFISTNNKTNKMEYTLLYPERQNLISQLEDSFEYFTEISPILP